MVLVGALEDDTEQCLQQSSDIAQIFQSGQKYIWSLIIGAVYAALLALSIPISFRDNTLSGQENVCDDPASPGFATHCYRYLNDITKQLLLTAITITCVLVVTIP